LTIKSQVTISHWHEICILTVAVNKPISFSYSQQLPFNCTFWFIDCCRSCTDLK